MEERYFFQQMQNFKKREKNLNLKFKVYIKNELKWILDLSVKDKPIKLLAGHGGSRL